MSLFNKHPKEVGMNYFTHMIFAFKVSLKTFYMGIVSFIHAFFPFLFTKTTSTMIKKMNDKLQGRSN